VDDGAALLVVVLAEVVVQLLLSEVDDCILRRVEVLYTVSVTVTTLAVCPRR
jgi:hypothetical protein